MTAERDTNAVFVSDRLEATVSGLLAALRPALPGVSVTTVEGTRDIWCRDYMPVQVGAAAFRQFVYAPDYLRGFPDLVTPPTAGRLPFMADYRQEPIVLDGGNVVASRGTVILTDKVYRENPLIPRPRLRGMLEAAFGARCVIVLKEPYDPVGHADGAVRFLDERRVVTNDHAALDPGYGRRLRAALEAAGLNVETLPAFRDRARMRAGDLPSAVGLYVNYLRVGDRVVLPGYNRPEDAAAVETLRRLLPAVSVAQVPCRRLAEMGGVLNCVTWTARIGR